MSDRFRLAVSVGHGRKLVSGRNLDDPGAVNANMGLREFEVCKRMGSALVELLHTDRRFKVQFIPPGKMPLGARVKMLNAMDRDEPFDLAVELHLNSFTDTSADYAEVYHFPGSTAGKRYGDVILASIIEGIGARDGNLRGAEPFGDAEWEKQRNYFVRGTRPPALVLEPWFVSNDERAEQAIIGGLVADTAIAYYRGLVNCLEVELT